MDSTLNNLKATPNYNSQGEVTYTTPSLREFADVFNRHQINAKKAKQQQNYEEDMRIMGNLNNAKLNTTDHYIASQSDVSIKKTQVAYGIKEFYKTNYERELNDAGIDLDNMTNEEVIDRYTDLNPNNYDTLKSYVVTPKDINNPLELYDEMGWLPTKQEEDLMLNLDGTSRWIEDTSKMMASGIDETYQGFRNFVNGVQSIWDDEAEYFGAFENYTHDVLGKDVGALSDLEVYGITEALKNKDIYDNYKPTPQKAITKSAAGVTDTMFTIAAPGAKFVISALAADPLTDSAMNFLGESQSVIGQIVSGFVPPLEIYRMSLTDEDKKEFDAWVGSLVTMGLLSKYGGKYGGTKPISKQKYVSFIEKVGADKIINWFDSKIKGFSKSIKGTVDNMLSDKNIRPVSPGENIGELTEKTAVDTQDNLVSPDGQKLKQDLSDKILGKTIVKNLNAKTSESIMRSLDEVSDWEDMDINKLIDEKIKQKQSKIDSENKLLAMDKKLYKQNDILESTKTDNMPKGYDFVGNILNELKQIYEKMTPKTDEILGEEYPFITDDIKFVEDMIVKYENEGLTKAEINEILRNTSSAVDLYNDTIGIKNGTPLESEAALEKLRLQGKSFVNKGLEENLEGTENSLKTLDRGISDDINLIKYLEKRSRELRGEYAGQGYQGKGGPVTTLKRALKKIRPFKARTIPGAIGTLIEKWAAIGDLNIIELNKKLPEILRDYMSANEGNPNKIKAIQDKIDSIYATTEALVKIAEVDSELAVLEAKVDSIGDGTSSRKARRSTQVNKGKSLFEKDRVRILQEKYIKEFADLLKEGGATEDELVDVKNYMQKELFDM